MAFVIKNISGVEPSTIAYALENALARSRFTATVERNITSKVSIHNVRLRQKKYYCGNHPYACPVHPGGERPHKRLNYLEGADWVGFNDMINDVLDELGCVADVASSLCIIRKGERRRTEYHGHTVGNGSEWDKNTSCNFYVDCRGMVPPKTEFPIDTPGLAEWKAKI